MPEVRKDVAKKRTALFYHDKPVRLIGVGPMGAWFKHVLTGERYLVPSPYQLEICIFKTPKLDASQQSCVQCGWKSLRTYKCQGSCGMVFSASGCA